MSAAVQAQAVWDGRELGDAALARHGNDTIAACAWIAFTWRSQPDDAEQVMQQVALDVVLDQGTDMERAQWTWIREDVTVASAADVLAKTITWQTMRQELSQRAA